MLNPYGRLNAIKISFGARNYSELEIKVVSVKGPSSTSAVQVIKILVPNDADSGKFQLENLDWRLGAIVTAAKREIVVKAKEWVLFSELRVLPVTGYPSRDYEHFGDSFGWTGGISSKWDTESKKSFELPGHEWLNLQYNYSALVTNRFISRGTQGQIIDNRFFRPETYTIGDRGTISNLKATTPHAFKDPTGMYELSLFNKVTLETRQFTGRRYIRQMIRDPGKLICDLEIEYSVPDIFGEKTKSDKEWDVHCIGYPTNEMLKNY